LIKTLATCQFIERKENVIFIGQPGTGKSHLSVALGMKACEADYSVRFTTIHHAHLVPIVGGLPDEEHHGRTDRRWFHTVGGLASHPPTPGPSPGGSRYMITGGSFDMIGHNLGKGCWAARPYRLDTPHFLVRQGYRPVIWRIALARS
jgi:hypothetical protein